MTRMLTIEQLGDLGTELGRGGQARVIELGGEYSTQVAKLYHGELRPTSQALAEVIDWRDTLTTRQQALIDARTSWPTAMLSDRDGDTVGVMLPAIPRAYFAELQVGGRPKVRPRELGYLLNPKKSSDLGLPPPDLHGKMRVCRAWLSVFDVLDSHGIVFGDISMRNLLWCPDQNGDGYLIDCDTAQTDPPLSPSPWTRDWDDPYVDTSAAPQPADLASDRYKLTLAIYRTIVGHPSQRPASTLSEIRAAIPEPVPDAFAELLLAGSGPDRAARPSPAHWLTAVDNWIPPEQIEPRQPDRRDPMPQGIPTTSLRERRWVPVEPVEESEPTGARLGGAARRPPKSGPSTASRPRSYKKVGEGVAASPGTTGAEPASSQDRHRGLSAPSSPPASGLRNWVTSVRWRLLIVVILILIVIVIGL